jgi:hypothetical protein
MEKVNKFYKIYLAFIYLLYIFICLSQILSLSYLFFQAELAERLEKRKARFGEIKAVENKVSYNKVKIVK